MAGQTLFDKLWCSHVVASLGDGADLLHVDRHLLHDLGAPRGLLDLKARGYRLRNPELTFATAEHAVSTATGRHADSNPQSARLMRDLRAETARHGIRLFDLGEEGQGIVHVIGPELGLSLPGALIVCGDSHTCTHGALGALAFGIGSSELVHVLATQTLVQRKPKRMRVRFEGARGIGVTPKDMILHLIGRIGTAAGTGFAVEYAGSAIRALGMEGRMTICNLSIELGAKMGMIAPDETTCEYLAGRRYAPKGAARDAAIAAWRRLPSDEGAVFDREVEIDVAAIAPQITWGTSPQDVVAVDARIPDPASEPDAARRQVMNAALAYMGLAPGAAIAGTRVDRVCSCTNSRLSDLRDAAAIARRGTVAAHVEAWVVPGSERVKREAEAAGLARCVRAPGPWRPTKLRFEVETERAPGATVSPFAARHIEQPGSRQ